MNPIFRGERTPLFLERASLEGEGRVQWKLRTRGGQQLDSHAEAALVEFGEQPGLSITAKSEYQGRQFSYLRGQFVLTPEECKANLTFLLELATDKAAGVQVILALYEDAAYTTQILSTSVDNIAADGVTRVELHGELLNEPLRYHPIHGFIQVCLTTGVGGTVRVGELAAHRFAPNPQYRPLRVRYDAFGDETKASSRLRVWKFIELLRQEGHHVEVGGKNTDFDIYFCQKVRPFNTVREVRKTNPHAVVVYDFDDNFILPTEGVLPEFLAFINHVDLVTCGSEYLATTVRQWHGNVYVLENPLDLDYTVPVRTSRGAMQRVGWFGAPEGLTELAKATIKQPVETVTRGGTIEYNLRTVDQDLTGFDLLLFPVEETPWNLAKNANRMMKAVGLGVPVLASSTPEQLRFAKLVDLPAACVCDSFESWQQHIDKIRKNYTAVEKATAAACEKVRHLYSPRNILTGLFEHIYASTGLGGVAKRPRSVSDNLKRIAVLTVDASDPVGTRAGFDHAGIEWGRFHSINLFSTTNHQNEFLRHAGPDGNIREADYLEVFAMADRLVASCEAEYLLVVPPGAALNFGAAAVIDDLLEQGVDSVAIFARSGHYSHLLYGVPGAHPVRDMLMNIGTVGPLLVNTRWLRDNLVLWDQSFDLWPWAVATKALGIKARVQVVDLPMAFDAAPREDLNVPSAYAHWLEEHQPAVARELPDIRNQWGRLLTDIVTMVGRNVEVDMPSAFAELYGQYQQAVRRLASAEKELKNLKAAKK